MKEYEANGLIRYTRTGTPTLLQYADTMQGVPLQNIWTDIPPINPQAKERLGYSTQKPLKLLERIIQSSTNEDDVVFDPFCGCATTIEAAHRLGRQWIGIDIAIHAIKRVAKVRLLERMKLLEGVNFTIEGVPRNLEGAQDLWSRDKYHFQKWAVEQVDGFVTTRQSGDGGVDGRIYFAMPETDSHKSRPLESMAIEVKGGKNVGINVVRELRGVLDNDQALIAGLIVMDPLGATKERNFPALHGRRWRHGRDRDEICSYANTYCRGHLGREAVSHTWRSRARGPAGLAPRIRISYMFDSLVGDGSPVAITIVAEMEARTGNRTRYR